ncbi:MAG: MBL fold metallo-hydrolase [Verrucomicrobia bacterium]|nr:MBL fold metallo-hydrolase [Verrucomicrobiota bacterium]
MNGHFVFLGTGGSAGVPLIGCKCPICTSTSPRNKRLRPAGLIQVGGRNYLIDVTPDFRQQALQSGIDKVDGLLLTHTHYDHIAGIDDLRIFYVRQNTPVPCLLSKESFDELKIRYYYFFKPSKNLSAQLTFQELAGNEGEVDFAGLHVRYFSYYQGDMLVNGFRLGNFAYVSDIQNIDESVIAHLQGVEHLVLSALRPEKTHFHLSLDEAVEFARRAGVKHTWITHLSHYLEHDETNRKLPPEVQLGHDGQKFAIEV